MTTVIERLVNEYISIYSGNVKDTDIVAVLDLPEYSTGSFVDNLSDGIECYATVPTDRTNEENLRAVYGDKEIEIFRRMDANLRGWRPMSYHEAVKKIENGITYIQSLFHADIMSLKTLHKYYVTNWVPGDEDCTEDKISQQIRLAVDIYRDRAYFIGSLKAAYAVCKVRRVTINGVNFVLYPCESAMRGDLAYFMYMVNSTTAVEPTDGQKSYQRLRYGVTDFLNDKVESVLYSLPTLYARLWPLRKPDASKRCDVLVNHLINIGYDFTSLNALLDA